MLVGSELADKGIVNDVGPTGGRRFNVDDGVVAFRPQRRTFSLGDEKTFSGKVADFQQGNGQPVAALVKPLHRQVEPVAAQGRFLGFHLADDFPAAGGRLAEIGAQPGTAGKRG